MGSSTAKATETARATSLIAGIDKHFANVATITLASRVYTPAQIAAAFQLLADLYAEVDAAKAVVKTKLTTERAQAPALQGLMGAFVSFLRITFSESPDVLADFGLEPTKERTPLTTEQQAVAVAKRKATREARGTRGPKARLAIKGDVIGVTVTTVKG